MPPTAEAIRALLAHLLAGATPEPEEHWLARIGEVRVYPTALRPRCNWTVEAFGDAGEIGAIEKAVDLVKGVHPYAAQPE